MAKEADLISLSSSMSVDRVVPFGPVQEHPVPPAPAPAGIPIPARIASAMRGKGDYLLYIYSIRKGGIELSDLSFSGSWGVRITC